MEGMEGVGHGYQSDIRLEKNVAKWWTFWADSSDAGTLLMTCRAAPCLLSTAGNPATR